MAAQPGHVFIDTQVFDQHHFDFTSLSFKRFLRLISSGDLSLVLTDVTLSEIRAHLQKAAQSAAKQISNYKKVHRAVKQVLPQESLQELSTVTEDDILARLNEELDRFVTDSRAQVVSVDTVVPSVVFDKYFRSAPPFNDGAKKHEFPDAFAAAALEHWCRNNAQSQLYVISNDGDWRRLCAETANFTHLHRLEEMLEHFVEAELVVALKQQIDVLHRCATGALKDHMGYGDIFFYPGDSLLNGEIVDASLNQVELASVDVVAAQSGDATLSVDCIATFSLEVKRDDPNSVWRDDEDGSRHSVWVERGIVERSVAFTAICSVAYEADDPSRHSIDSVTFPQEAICVDVVPGELTVNYDYDARDN